MHMKIALTDEDRNVALEYATRLEKSAKNWRVYRWSTIFLFILSVGLLLGTDHMCKRLQLVGDLPEEIATVEIEPTPELNASRIEAVETATQLKVAILRRELSIWLKVLPMAFLSVAMLCHVLSNWRKDRRDQLIAKLLCGISTLEEDQPKMEDANKPGLDQSAPPTSSP